MMWCCFLYSSGVCGSFCYVESESRRSSYLLQHHMLKHSATPLFSFHDLAQFTVPEEPRGTSNPPSNTRVFWSVQQREDQANSLLRSQKLLSCKLNVMIYFWG